ncbi:MAG: ferritin-like domain-containing protein [Acidimicrobiales bacterium]
MALDLERTLERVQDRQWALADIDWSAPGANLVSDDQRARLKPFMADLVWVEHIGGRAFAALARKAEDPTLSQLYRYFHAEEERHANAELALMRRWGMLDGDERPAPNVNLRFAMAFLDRRADELPLMFLASFIPLLEVALDGALLKFLTDAVEDPICQAVFDKVNNDESRHLAVGFHVMDLVGATPVYRQLGALAAAGADPFQYLWLLGAFPLLSRMRGELMKAGLDPQRLEAALERYGRMGANGAHTNSNTVFQVARRLGEMFVDSPTAFRLVVNTVMTAVDRIPEPLLPRLPTWTHSVTYEAVA